MNLEVFCHLIINFLAVKCEEYETTKTTLQAEIIGDLLPAFR